MPDAFYAFRPGPDWQYREQLGFRDRLTIVGGGHVSLALSKTLALLDFELTVLDDRPDLPTLLANEAAHRRQIVDYETIINEIPTGPHQYVVVMTVGYYRWSPTPGFVVQPLRGKQPTQHQPENGQQFNNQTIQQ